MTSYSINGAVMLRKRIIGLSHPVWGDGFPSVERKCHICSPDVKFCTYLAVVISKDRREHYE